ncbi:MAG: hypothetical protein LKI25_01645 [Atopobiaceae bacterium]|nr:hypothetical protein [Atopobiaceae bacterium]MCI2172912.1 hypothetical protein [Atopobiaceae bacterium]MCI2208317.1 hypothetical protein [Atopobiaceae bacterium]
MSSKTGNQRPVYEHGVDYDPSSRFSIVSYAQQLEKTTLRKKLGLAPNEKLQRKGKGGFGETVEEVYFGYEPNSIQGPDFPDAGLELKVTPVKRLKDGTLAPKERLVVTMINYMTIVTETFDSSTLESKLRDVLFMFYEYERDKDPLDYFFRLVEEWHVPEEDRSTIRKDWETIAEKVKTGHAHELSSGDTMYLEACTKAADSSKTREQPFSEVPAKPRAFALKQSYMRSVLARGLSAQSIEREGKQEGLDLVSLVKTRFQPFLGKSSEELAALFGIKNTDKGFYSRITRRILGIQGSGTKIAEFEKADINLKSIRLRQNGMPKEAISFPAFRYCDIVDVPWEDSDLYAQLTRPFLFVLFQIEGAESDKEAPTHLKGIRFWSMPSEDLAEAERCYEQTRELVRNGQYDHLPRSTENRCCHVRPHGKDSHDTLPTPQGTQEPKRCFWLNARYIAGQLALMEISK